MQSQRKVASFPVFGTALPLLSVADRPVRLCLSVRLFPLLLQGLRMESQCIPGIVEPDPEPGDWLGVAGWLPIMR